MGSLTALDIVVLTLVGGGAVLGFSRGLVQEVLSLLSWVLAIAAVRLFHAPVSDALTGRIGSAGGAAMLGFVLLFGVVFLFGKWLSRSIGDRSRRSLIGGFDRGLGAGFGAIKGLLLATIGFMTLTLLYNLGYGNQTLPVWMTDSRTYPALSASSAAASEIIAERRKAARQADDEPQDDSTSAQTAS